ncbi:MAG TPA: hypothetical protein PK156_24570, partial [Polyangium sp.]|nr:hypothetical protein [Polyangium sp.]
GATVDGGTQGGEYVAYNLFTHVPRFVVYKVDPARNLCFRIWLVGFSNPGTLTIDVTAPWVADRAEVTNNVADCTVTMGFPPQPQVFANGTSGMGTITVHGGFPCTVDVHATISFENIGTWVPASESFDVDGLNVDGGCG